MRIGLRCLSFILRNRLLGSGLRVRDRFMRRQLRCCLIKRLKRCVCGLLIWNDGSGKLIAPEPFMPTEVSLRIRGQVRSIGRSGMRSKSNMGMRILSRYLSSFILYYFWAVLMVGNVAY